MAVGGIMAATGRPALRLKHIAKAPPVHGGAFLLTLGVLIEKFQQGPFFARAHFTRCCYSDIYSEAV